MKYMTFFIWFIFSIWTDSEMSQFLVYILNSTLRVLFYFRIILFMYFWYIHRYLSKGLNVVTQTMSS